GEAIDVEPKVNEAYMQYEYDAAGNRITQYFTVVLTHETHYRYYANSNRLLTDGKWAYVYDANGNLVKKGNRYQIAGEQVTFTTDGPFTELWEYGYDLLNRLVAVKKNGVQVGSYVYDPTGLRVVKHGTKGETHYTFDQGGNAIYEKDIATGKERSYIWVGGQHFVRVDGGIGGTGEKYFYHTDHEGSLTAVTDSAGVVLWRSDNLPFGGKIEQDREYAFAEDHGFTGKEWDQDSGLYYFNARWYDSELGRFITEDSVVDPNNPNLYVYGANNPLRFTDPTGNFTLEFNSSWDDWRNWWSGLWSGKQTRDSSQKQSGSSEKNSIVNNKRKSEPSQPVTRQQYFGDQPQGEPVRYQEFPGPPPVSFPVYNLDQLPQSEQWKYVNQIDSNNPSLAT
ncbi:MAG: hypothetical protein M1511_18365, partial [Deltaproteobacteria bacterium]|nr:hypothetical protein [Deltaproteobacteria bacterium]